MLEVLRSVDDVFGVSRAVPLNYVARENVDGKFIESLTRTHHIVIFGSSKQGKTCLRKHCLDSDDYITVSCQNKWKLSELHSAILKQAGYEVRLSTSHATGGHAKIAASTGGILHLPLFAKAKTKVEGEGEHHREKTVTKKELELDPMDANDIIRALEEIKFEKYIALEDFHYLPDDTQRDFAFALKTFHEQSKISFIVTGVWREQNRLIAFNGDLTERVFSVDVDTWTREDLIKVIEEGEKFLNVIFQSDFQEAVLSNCRDSVHLVQEACRRACRESKIYNTQEATANVGTAEIGARLIKKIVDEQDGRYRYFITNFADGFQVTELAMPKWIVYSVLQSDISALEMGLRLRDISRIIKEKHPEGRNLNSGNITQALNSVSSLQRFKKIRPIVIDYDGTSRKLHVVDKGFLIWLANQDRQELLEDLKLE